MTAAREWKVRLWLRSGHTLTILWYAATAAETADDLEGALLEDEWLQVMTFGVGGGYRAAVRTAAVAVFAVAGENTRDNTRDAADAVSPVFNRRDR